MFILSVKNLSVSFGERKLLNNLNLNLKAGETKAIMSPSGSGKSTLLHYIAGFDIPSIGDIFWQDENILQARQKRSNFLGMIFQNHYLFQDLNIEENLKVPLMLNGQKDFSKIDDILQEVGLEGRNTASVNILSGGEKQRLAIARALIANPKLLLADEPTGSLDVENSQKVADMIFKIAKNKQSAVILVTHDINVANYADEILTLENGVLKKHV